MKSTLLKCASAAALAGLTLAPTSALAVREGGGREPAGVHEGRDRGEPASRGDRASAPAAREVARAPAGEKSGKEAGEARGGGKDTAAETVRYRRDGGKDVATKDAEGTRIERYDKDGNWIGGLSTRDDNPEPHDDDDDR